MLFFLFNPSQCILCIFTPYEIVFTVDTGFGTQIGFSKELTFLYWYKLLVGVLNSEKMFLSFPHKSLSFPPEPWSIQSSPP